MSTPRLRPALGRGDIVRGLIVLGTLLLSSSAAAQYAFDVPADNDEEGIRYFGSAKDSAGALLADVTFLLESKQASFVFITGPDGRFRGTLPLSISAAAITPKCWKAGLQSVRMVKRTAPKGARAAVQIDCVLERIASDPRELR